MSKIKDTEYLSISAALRARETRLLTRERMERMVDARSGEESAKVLAECGYPELPALTSRALDEMFSQARAGLYRELKGAVPDPGLVEVFQMKYDYHNAKVLVKAAALGIDGGRLLMEGGRWSAAQIRDAFQRDSLRDFTDPFRQAVAQAREALNAGGDPQLADFILDRACFGEMVQAAEDADSDFLRGYVRLLTDAANLRACVRAARMGKDSAFLSQVLLPGGNVSEKAVAAARGEELGALFQTGPLAQAAQLGAQAAKPAGGSLTAFERECDNAVTAYVAGAKRVPFGEETVIAYLYAKEAEFTAIRTIFASRRAGLDGPAIRERLRESYV